MQPLTPDTSRGRREVTVACTFTRDTATSSPCPGAGIPDDSFSSYCPLHTREDTMIPTWVCRLRYVGLHQLSLSRSPRVWVYVGFPLPHPGFLNPVALTRFTVPPSSLAGLLLHALTLPGGSPLTLVPEAGAVLRPRKEGHTRFTKNHRYEPPNRHLYAGSFFQP